MAHYPKVFISGSSSGGSSTTASSIFWNKGTNTDATDKTTGIYRLGSLLIGTASVNSNDRFVVSSTTGTFSLVVDNSGNIYNNKYGTSNTFFGHDALLLNSSGSGNTGIGNQSLKKNTTGANNTAVGMQTLSENIEGGSNVAVGVGALYINTSGSNNTAIGVGSLQFNTSGSNNTAVGLYSLLSNNTGQNNIALGGYTLYSNTNGYNNTAIGIHSMFNNTSGGNNTAIGYYSLSWNSIGGNNTAIGINSMFFNTSGGNNTAIGLNSLYSNTIGDQNTAIGISSLYNNTTNVNSLGPITGGSGYITGTYSSVQLVYATGSTAQTYPTATIVVGLDGTVSSVTLLTPGSGFKDTTIVLTALTSSLGGTGSGFSVGVTSLNTGYYNTAVGFGSLLNNTTGIDNTAVGHESLYSNTTGQNNTAVGYGALQTNTTGGFNVAIGAGSGVFSTSSTNEIVIGATAIGNGSNSVTLGNDNITKTILKGNIGLGTASPSTKLHIFATQSGAFRLEDGTQGPGYVLTSDVNGVTSWTSSLTGLSLLGNSEVISASVSATASLVVYDYSSSSIFYHATASTNFTANFTNLPTTNNRVLSATIVISQGSTAYIPNIVQITGVTQSVKWAGGTQSGTANSLDLISFNFIRTGNIWTNVIGQIAPFS